MNKAKVEIRPRLRVMAGAAIALGPGKAQLLELVQRTGSITRAAREMNMSYMRAWTLIRTMNRCFKEPVIISSHGGARGGGGAALTKTGREILALYQKMEADCMQVIDRAQKKLEKFLAV